MNPRLGSGAVAVLALALAAAAPADAATLPPPASVSAASHAVSAAGPPGPDERRNAISTARAAITSRAGAVRAADGDSFTLASTVAGPRGLQYLTFSRAHRGLPVYGGDVVVATDGSGAVVTTLTTGQRAAIDVPTRPAVKAADAAVTARAELPGAAGVADPVLVVHAASGRPRLAWEAVVTGAPGRPAALHVYVDARTGEVFDRWDEVRDGTGNSRYNGNPVTIDTSPSYTMRDPRRSGVQCGGQNGQPYTKSTDSWGNGSGTDLETACVDALFAAQKEWDMLRDWLGRNGVNGQGGGYPARVGLAEVNAYWTGSYATFGRNSGGTQQLTSMDVVGHEFGHGVFQFSGGGGAGSGNETGGLNESTGDIFGALTEAYANEAADLDPPDYLVGEEVNLSGSGPIRNMYNPSALGDPNCYSSAIPNTEVHAAAGPQNHWFYLVAEGTNPAGKPASARCDGGAAITGLGIRKAGEIFMAALNTKTAPWTHAKVRVATLQAAKTLYPGSCAEFAVVKAAWDGVSVGRQAGEPTCEQQSDDFSVALQPASGTAAPGQSVTTTVTTTVTGGSAQQVTLRTGPLPAGVTASFDPATISAGQSSRLTLATSAASPQGTHAITVIADGTAVDRQAAFTLQIGQASQDDYTMTVTPSSASVPAGQSATATLSTQVTAGQAQSVALSASGAPSGVSVSFSPRTVTAGQSATVTVTTTASVAPGTYPISLNGDGTSADHAAAFTLTVTGGQDTTWAPYTAYAAGDQVTYQGVRYRCLQGHTSLPGWEPPGVPALWQPV